MSPHLLQQKKKKKKKINNNRNNNNKIEQNSDNSDTQAYKIKSHHIIMEQMELLQK